MRTRALIDFPIENHDVSLGELKQEAAAELRFWAGMNGYGVHANTVEVTYRPEAGMVRVQALVEIPAGVKIPPTFTTRSDDHAA